MYPKEFHRIYRKCGAQIGLSNAMIHILAKEVLSELLHTIVVQSL